MTLYNRYHIEWSDGNVETFETSGERSARISILEDVGYTFGEDFRISTTFEIET